jgi:sugar O-acyltransferase (sialic acid O-acetyltransferase NeuD family)
MTKILGIFGSSGFAREVRDIANDVGFRSVFIVRAHADLDACVSPEDVILERDIAQHGDWQFAIGIGENASRQTVAQRFGDQLHFANLIHPSASFGKGQREAIEGRRGVIVCAGVRFTNNIKVGDFTIFNLNATIGHDAIVDDFANVSPGANISGNVRIGMRCWVGTGAAVNQGSGGAKLTIGPDTVIGSGSVVVKDCEPNAVYVGIPAKRIK